MPTVDPDVVFFTKHPARKFHIRPPGKVIVIDKAREAHVVDECEQEFRSLGPHRRDRRRVILCRADHRGNPLPDGQIFKLPLLLLDDETIEDEDGTLAAVVFEVMRERDEPQVMGF